MEIGHSMQRSVEIGFLHGEIGGEGSPPRRDRWRWISSMERLVETGSSMERSVETVLPLERCGNRFPLWRRVPFMKRLVEMCFLHEKIDGDRFPS